MRSVSYTTLARDLPQFGRSFANVARHRDAVFAPQGRGTGSCESCGTSSRRLRGNLLRSAAGVLEPLETSGNCEGVFASDCSISVCGCEAENCRAGGMIENECGSRIKAPRHNRTSETACDDCGLGAWTTSDGYLSVAVGTAVNADVTTDNQTVGHTPVWLEGRPEADDWLVTGKEENPCVAVQDPEKPAVLCGMDVTDRMVKEMQDFENSGGIIPGVSHARQLVAAYNMCKAGGRLDWKNGKGGFDKCNKGCPGTLVICDICFDDSVPGNIFYAHFSKVSRIPPYSHIRGFAANLGARSSPDGYYPAHDMAAINLGIDLPRNTTRAGLCKAIKDNCKDLQAPKKECIGATACG